MRILFDGSGIDATSDCWSTKAEVGRWHASLNRRKADDAYHTGFRVEAFDSVPVVRVKLPTNG